jgi:hypothetical protein
MKVKKGTTNNIFHEIFKDMGTYEEFNISGRFLFHAFLFFNGPRMAEASVKTF